jgi:hypothetical protein
MLCHHKDLFAQFIKLHKKEAIFLDSLFSSIMLNDALNGWQSITKC